MSLATTSGILRPVSLGGSAPTPLLWRSDASRVYHETGGAAAAASSVVSDETRSSPSGNNMCVRAGAAAMSSTSKKRQGYEEDEQQQEQEQQALYRQQQQHRSEGTGEGGHRDRDSKLRQLTACAAEQQHQHQQYHHYQHQHLHQQRHSSSTDAGGPRWPQKQQQLQQEHEHDTDSLGGGGGSSESGRLKRNKPVKWSAEEDRRLREAVVRFAEARWKDIATLVQTRNHVQCLQRWKKVLKPGLVKGQWSAEEDDRLVGLVEKGFRNWGQVASFMDGRTSKQCRERWCHHLDPAVRKGGYTTEEDELIIFLQGEVGNRWADIAKRLTGRTENAVKIRWKALNRRQRDARNKAAAAAASGSVVHRPSPRHPSGA
ncbi:unnamed protein product, partial [Scytosiphon promiscuus]